MAKIFTELVTIFRARPGTKCLSPFFCNAVTARLPNFMFRRLWMQYTEREHTKQVLKTGLHFNCFTHYSDTDTQGSQESNPNVSFRWFHMAQILNDLYVCNLKNNFCPLPNDCPPKSSCPAPSNNPSGLTNYC